MKTPAYRFLDVHGCRLRVQSLGTGPLAVVFVPDPPNVLEHHAEAFAQLAREVRVVGLELPGFGFSTARRGFRVSFDAYADLLLGALEQLDVERAVLALSCVAGLASLFAANRAPDRVAGIVGIQTADVASLRAWADRLDPRRVLRTRGIGQAFVHFRKRRIAQGWYDVAVADAGPAAPLSRGGRQGLGGRGRIRSGDRAAVGRAHRGSLRSFRRPAGPGGVGNPGPGPIERPIAPRSRRTFRGSKSRSYPRPHTFRSWRRSLIFGAPSSTGWCGRTSASPQGAGHRRGTGWPAGRECRADEPRRRRPRRSSRAGRPRCRPGRRRPRAAADRCPGAGAQ